MEVEFRPFWENRIIRWETIAVLFLYLCNSLELVLQLLYDVFWTNFYLNFSCVKCPVSSVQWCGWREREVRGAEELEAVQVEAVQAEAVQVEAVQPVAEEDNKQARQVLFGRSRHLNINCCV